MCVACRQMKEKNQLRRYVVSEGVITEDTAKKAEGRGAYLCMSPACEEKCEKKNLLRRAFRIK